MLQSSAVRSPRPCPANQSAGSDAELAIEWGDGLLVRLKLECSGCGAVSRHPARNVRPGHLLRCECGHVVVWTGDDLGTVQEALDGLRRRLDGQPREPDGPPAARQDGPPPPVDEGREAPRRVAEALRECARSWNASRPSADDLRLSVDGETGEITMGDGRRTLLRLSVEPRPSSLTVTYMLPGSSSGHRLVFRAFESAPRWRESRLALGMYATDDALAVGLLEKGLEFALALL